MKIIEGNICAPLGFLATGVHAGIRKKNGKADLALIVSTSPTVSAGVFTTNLVKAAPVLLTQSHLACHDLRAVVVNSGIANACTGALGMEHAIQMAETTAQQLGLQKHQIGVASTGVISTYLPIDKINVGIEHAAKQLDASGDLAAEAMMTTDTFAKSIAIEMDINGVSVKLGGIAKGSGMIHPNMATTLGFITTDASIDQCTLELALSKAIQSSFNMITVDGDCSTNDMMIVMSNGLASNEIITSLNSNDGKTFYEGLLFVCTYLAKLVAKDGEGATKLIEVNVQGAATQQDADIAARAVCRSPLVKAAIFGNDPNFGRIAAALGASGAALNPDDLCVSLGNVPLLQSGSPVPFDESEVRALLNDNTVFITAHLGNGTNASTAWGCDLTPDYVKINASYRS